MSVVPARRRAPGLVIPGFVPSPLGEMVEYVPTWVELGVTAGIWAMGLFIVTVLVRVTLPIELGDVRSPYLEPEPSALRPRRRRERTPRRRRPRKRRQRGVPVESRHT